MSLNKWFAKGMAFSEYVENMQVNRSELESIYKQLEFEQDDVQYFSKLQDKKLHIITLTADWCGDAALCVPVLQRLAEIASIETRFLIRDDNLALMDQYLTNGTARSIPIFIFTDEEGNELAKWGPRSPEVQELVIENKAKLPDPETPGFADKQKAMFSAFKTTVITNPKYWQSVVRDVRRTLATKLV